MSAALVRGLTLMLLCACFMSADVSRTRAQGGTPGSYSQDSRSYFDFGETFYYNIVQQPDGRSFDVRLNTASAMFAFLRSERPKELAQGEYYAVRDIVFEVTEPGNAQAVLTKSVVDTVYVPRYEATVSKSLWHPLNERITVPAYDPAKKYSLRIEIRDQILGKLSMRPIIVELKQREFRDLREMGALDSTAIGVSDVTLLDTLVGSAPLRALSHGWGSTYAFSRDILGTFSVILGESVSSTERPTAEITLTQLSNIADPSDTGVKAHVSLSASDFQAGPGFALASTDTGFTFERATSAGNGREYSALFTIPGKQFMLGRYRLTVTVKAGGFSRSVSNELTLQWLGMPVSIEDPRDAIAPLIHVMTDQELKDIQRGKREDQIRKLWAYWKKQDPTPETAYNERMAAFYQRVDYAYFNFASGRVLDGALTDRGKIYILYGPPSKTERRLLPGEAPFEVWTYAASNVRKAFKFVDKGGHGEYKLVDIQTL